MKNLGTRLAVGDQAAFAELYQACADRLHHYLTARLGSRQDAEDVLQETFIRLVRNRGKLQSVNNLPAYLFTIARNDQLALFRYRQHLMQLVLSEKGFIDAKEDPQVDNRLGQPDCSALDRQCVLCVA